MKKIILLLVFTLLLTSCSTTTPDSTINIDYVLLGVPYEKYVGYNWCLPACGTMVLKYYGVYKSQTEIYLNIKPLKNVMGRFVAYIESLGLEADYTRKNIEEIKGLLIEGIPVIAIQDYNLWNNTCHARVIVGFDNNKKEFISNDPTLGMGYRISYGEFEELNTDKGGKVIIIKGW